MKKLSEKQREHIGTGLTIILLISVFVFKTIFHTDWWYIALFILLFSNQFLSRYEKGEEQKKKGDVLHPINLLSFCLFMFCAFFLFQTTVIWAGALALVVGSISILIFGRLKQRDKERDVTKTHLIMFIVIAFFVMGFANVTSERLERVVHGPWIQTIVLFEGEISSDRYEAYDGKREDFQAFYHTLSNANEQLDGTTIVLKDKQGEDKIIDLKTWKEEKIYFVWTNEKMDIYRIWLIPADYYGDKNNKGGFLGYIQKGNENFIYKFPSQVANSLKSGELFY